MELVLPGTMNEKTGSRNTNTGAGGTYAGRGLCSFSGKYDIIEISSYKTVFAMFYKKLPDSSPGGFLLCKIELSCSNPSRETQYFCCTQKRVRFCLFPQSGGNSRSYIQI
jgi:hypothetical protein